MTTLWCGRCSAAASQADLCPAASPRPPGDCFAAGFLYSLLRGYPARRCAQVRPRAAVDRQAWLPGKGPWQGPRAARALPAPSSSHAPAPLCRSAAWPAARWCRRWEQRWAPTSEPALPGCCLPRCHRLLQTPLPPPGSSSRLQRLAAHLTRQHAALASRRCRPLVRWHWLHSRMHGELAGSVVRDSAAAVQRELLDAYALIERKGVRSAAVPAACAGIARQARSGTPLSVGARPEACACTSTVPIAAGLLRLL